MDNKILDIRDLEIKAISNENNESTLIHGISFDILKGEILGLVGESGSGKSISSLAILGLLDKPLKITKGEILFDDSKNDLLSLSEKELQKLRGKEISMIFQEPMSSLNPVMKCGKQVDEIMLIHGLFTKKEAKKRTLDLFEKVKIPDPERAYDSFPHQLSGGQLQRVMIAMALGCEPKLLIADECTTALDVTVQKEIVQLLLEINKKTGISILFISHDLEVVKDIADRVMVMRKGQIIEQASKKDLFLRPKTSYTLQLLSSRPPQDIQLSRLPKPSFFQKDKDILEKVAQFRDDHVVTEEQISKRKEVLENRPTILSVKSLYKTYPTKFNFWGKPTSYVKAINNVSFDIKEGETVGLVGESGCGKSTLSKTILKLIPADSGDVIFKEDSIMKMTRRKLRQSRRNFQYIFQNPYASLNPRFTIGYTIKEPMDVHGIGKSSQRKNRVKELLELVDLEPDHYSRYPHQFSGGQRQRICIARALAMEPELLVCDEIVSALDVSVQAQVLNLLIDLREELGLSMLFVSHDLSIVKFMSDRLLVMKNGVIIERGYASDIYISPKQEYTQKLLNAIPGKTQLI